MVKIEYQWHPLFGQSVQVTKRYIEKTGTFYVIELPDSTFYFLPDWMTDPVICANFELGSPRCSLEGLFSLRQLLDAHLLPVPTRSTMLKRKHGYEKGASCEDAEKQSPPEESSFPGSRDLAADTDGVATGSDTTSNEDDPRALLPKGG